MKPAPKVLIVEDDFMIADYFRVVIEHLGYPICGVAATADEAVRMAHDEDPAMVLMDVRLRGKRDGVDAALEIRENKPVPIAFVTASQEPMTLNRIKSAQPAAILLKPIREQHLKDLLSKHCPTS